MLRPAWLPAAVLVACTPSLNWREVTVEGTTLRATMPCKPDSAERKIAFTTSRDWVVHAAGCEAGGASFAILHADVGAAAEAGDALTQWRAATLAGLHAIPSQESQWVPPGALALPQSIRVRASLRRADGTSLQMDSAYFARGGQVFQAVVYAPRLSAETEEPFFTGMRFQ